MLNFCNSHNNFFFFFFFVKYDDKEAYENFKQFYEDTLPEFKKAGTVVQFKVKMFKINEKIFQKGDRLQWIVFTVNVYLCVMTDSQ